MPQIAQFAFYAAIALALIYLPFSPRQPSWLRSALKTAPLLLFGLAAWAAGANQFLTGALLLSALGDFALSRPGSRAFLYGLSSFALAHILYTLLFFNLSQAPLWSVFAGAPILALGMLGLAFSTETWLAPFTGAMRWPVRAYIVLITLMMLQALSLPGAYVIATFGAGIFVVSDLILSLRLFRLKGASQMRVGASLAVWVFYVTGQAMILWAIALA